MVKYHDTAKYPPPPNMGFSGLLAEKLSGILTAEFVESSESPL